MKKCKMCCLSLSVSCFGKHPENADGLKGKCKNCLTKMSNAYKKTKSGLPARMYENQKTNSKRRRMSPPAYTIEELRKWLTEQTLFDILYENWKESGYVRTLVPSCDRIDDRLPYTLENIVLMTWAENKDKGHKMTRSTQVYNPTLLNGGHSSVEKWSKDKKLLLDVYISQAEAARQNPGLYQANINMVCTGKLKSSGGFFWKYIGHTKG